MTRIMDISEKTEELIAELEQEARSTRRVLERVPESRLSWKPHPKSSTLGQLALHVAKLPAMISHVLSQDSLEAPDFRQEEARSVSQLTAALDESIAGARGFFSELTPERANGVWRMMKGGREIMAAPRLALIRSLMLNHWYHHRGSLIVYLRLLDVPLPSVYGPTADENPFAGT
jgi:uncharacterized damage-inducible protein DinB